eukprot:jgi/Hompol1/6606/HPOL_000603-RA
MMQGRGAAARNDRSGARNNRSNRSAQTATRNNRGHNGQRSGYHGYFHMGAAHPYGPPVHGAQLGASIDPNAVDIDTINWWIRSQIVLVLLFANAASLKAALGRPHTEYEGGHLKGPLKGINFPTALLDDWASRTSDITECEEAVLAIVGSKDMDGADSGNSDCSARPLYVIAGLANDPSTLLHEWAHARFFLDEQFRAVCTAEWNQLEPDVRLAIERELAMRNYKPDVFIDEFQAYVCESSEDFGRRWSHKLRLPHTRLRSLLNLPETLK